MSVVGAAVRKEIQVVLRDRGALISLFAMPVVFMGVFGAMFSKSGAPESTSDRVLEALQGASSFQLYVPGNAVLFGFFLAMTVGISIVGERKTGTFRRILAAPVRRSTVLLAKLVPYYLIGLAQMTFLLATGAIVFGMRVAGSVVGLAVLTAAVVFAAVALGLVVASFSGTERQVGAIGSVCLLVMGLLGGGMVPRPFMPDTMKQVGMFTPHGWALDGYYELLIRDGTGLVDVAPQIAVVLGFGVLFAVIGTARFRFER